MERVYFLLKGDGPEVQAIEAYKAECDEVFEKWNTFVEKWGNGFSEFYRARGFLGIVFGNRKDGLLSLNEIRKNVPKGWIPDRKQAMAYRPKKTECPEAYAEWKALPYLPLGDYLNTKFNSEIVYHPSGRMLFISYDSSPAEGYILSCPINKNGGFYVPKQDHEELTASRYLELTKKEK